MTNILSTKEIIHPATLGIPEITKNTVSISFTIGAESLIRSKNVASEKHKIENHLKIYYM